MTDTDADIPNGRVSSQQILRDLQKDVRELEKTIAAFTPQLVMLVAVSKETQQELGRLHGRQEASDRASLLLTARVQQLEERPIAMSMKERGAIEQKQVETDKWVTEFREENHKLRGRLQLLQQFSPDERDEIRGHLKLLRRNEVDEMFDRSQRAVLQRVITTQEAWEQRRKEHDTEESLVRVNLRSAKPGHILTAIIGTFAILTFLIVYVFPHIRFHG